MRKLLLLMLMIPGFAIAHSSDRSYCATGQGVIGEPQYQCFNTIEEAEAWIQRDDGTFEGYALQSPAPSPPCALTYACELKYHVEYIEPEPLADPQYDGADAGSPSTPHEFCGGSGDYACGSSPALVSAIMTNYSVVPDEFIGAFTVIPTSFGTVEPYATDVWKFRGYFGSVAMTVSSGPGPWALNKWQVFVCPLLYGVVTSSSYWPRVCHLGITSSVWNYSPRQHDVKCKKGNPCIPATGNKVQSDTDFTWNGTAFKRSYSSIRDFPAQSQMGLNWSHTYYSRLMLANASNVWYVDERNLIDRFREDPNAGTYHYAAVNETGMTMYPEGTWPALTYVVVKDSERRRFNLGGTLIAIEYDDPSRNVTLEYCPTSPTSSDPCRVPGALYKVTNALGRELVFDYADNPEIPSADLVAGRWGKLIAVIADGVAMVEYDYDSEGRFITADYTPSGGAGAREYHYAESTHLCLLGDGTATSSCPSHGFPYHLTGISDENGARYANFTYDDLGRATSTAYDADPSPSTADEVSRYEFEYLSDSTVVTDPLGRVDTVYYGDQMFPKLDEQATPEGDHTYTYDADNRMTSHVDPRGVRTEYEYAYGDRLAAVIEAEGTPQQRTIETDWELSFNKPTERRVLDASDTLVAQQEWTYNSRGQVLTASQVDPVTSATRTTTYTYCESGDVSTPGTTCPYLGQLKSINGPRTDVTDVTTFTYYASTDLSGCSTGGTCHRKGDLWKVTNAAGHINETLRYDVQGRPLEIEDPNGVSTTFTYAPRGWLATRTTDGATTTYTYDAHGQVTRITDPDGAYTDYEYDAAHRLVAVEDSADNRIEYTLDDMGNRTVEDTRDDNAVLKRTLSRVYDQLSRLEQTLDAQSRATEFEYDEAGNQTAVVDALTTRTENTYDPLSRLVETLQDVGGIAASTEYGYDANDQLVTVTDPKGLVTTYTYDGLGSQTELDSPDTGVTAYDYDIAGNRIEQTDARSVVTGYDYDELNRLIAIDYPSTGLDVTFAYDEADGTTGCTASHPEGRLTTMTDGSGSTVYCYDAHGQVTEKTQTVASTTLTVEYRYTSGGRLEGMTLPSGIDVEYTYDAQGRVLTVEVDGDDLIDDIDYLPFGPISRIEYGNGYVQQRSYDQNYWATVIEPAAGSGLDLQFDHDALGNIIELTTPAAQIDYGYDALSRLTDADVSSTQLYRYTYDDTGNRLSRKDGSSAVQSYVYPGGSHRLQLVDGDSRTYDANGNTTGLQTSVGSLTLAYGAHNRLSTASDALGTVGAYTYSGRGERVRKQTLNDDLVFIYDESGRLLGEYDDGVAVREYVWIGKVPVGMIVASTLYAIESDHLDTPRRAFNVTTSAIAWEWLLSNEPFGDSAPIVPGGTGVELMLRLPGQYFDVESGLHHNYYRDYEPGTGRYAESDPIGLAGGVTTYAYVGSAPFRYSDPYGLQAVASCCARAQAATPRLDRDENGNQAGGRVICCNGEMFACVFTPGDGDQFPGANQVRRCVTDHEEFHKAHVNPCECRTEPYAPQFYRWRQNRSECGAYRLQRQCLRRAAPTCGTSQACSDYVRAYLSATNVTGAEWCRRAGFDYFVWN